MRTTTAPPPLARLIADAYRIFRDGLTDDPAATLAVIDWSATTRPLADALRTVGGRASWLSRESAGPDDPAFVVASIDPATGLVRLDEATAREVEGVPSADRVDTMGDG